MTWWIWMLIGAGLSLGVVAGAYWIVTYGCLSEDDDFSESGNDWNDYT